jgi:heat-inducible transcriptional repressor
VKESKSLPIKKLGKQERERKVLIGLVDHYIKTGKPVGSHTLQEAGFADLSSATLRNYFVQMEKEGYLIQSHISGGRIPTPLAYRIYAQTFEDQIILNENNYFETIRIQESKEIAASLQQAGELLSQLSQCAVFISAPRFDHDFVVEIKLMTIDDQRCLCVLITDFGVVQTEILPLPHGLNLFSVKRIETYFHWRLTGLDQPENIEKEELALAQSLYHEVMIRYIVGYSNFIDEDLYRTGFSRLLSYPEFQEAAVLSSSLSLFENLGAMRKILRETVENGKIKYWIGSDLNAYHPIASNCSIIAMPYFINKTPAGAMALLGSTRVPYPQLFSLVKFCSQAVSESLTRNLYKFKVNFRQPEQGAIYLQKEEHHVIGQSRLILLEDNRVSQIPKEQNYD